MRMWLVTGFLLAGVTGPFDIALLRTSAAPEARGSAKLVYAPSPFGVAVTPAGIPSFDVRVELEGLPAPSTLGDFRGYVAWAATSDLSRWVRLGTVRNGTSQVGRIEINKFLFVITAEADTLAATRSGPTVLHGVSPTTWLQSLLTHALFRGIPPG